MDMLIEQTVEIPQNHRIYVDLPSQIPAGKAKIALTITNFSQKEAANGGLSTRFAGALHLSDEQYAAFQNDLREGRRAEWERDIC